VLCSGKVAFDLMEARDAAGITDTQIVRIEQIYPFPGEPLAARLAKMPALEEIVWCQEEPKNNGSWFFVEPLIEEAVEGRRQDGPRPLCRSPCFGLARHGFGQAPHARTGRAGCRCAGPVGPFGNPPSAEGLSLRAQFLSTGLSNFPV
jgi:2-oxoglutarate dehydrogenase E1 component